MDSEQLRKDFSFPESEQLMALRSAFEDLKETTLRRVSGLLARLEYLAGLRTADGKYSHWGLARTHGEAAAQEAISQAHHATTAGVLRTPLRRMVQDAEASSEVKGLSAESYAKELQKNVPGLLPSSPAAGSEKHLNSVLRALSYLTKPR